MTSPLEQVCANLRLYSAAFLKVKDKNSNIVPFVFNSAQVYLDRQLDAQLERIGMVRVLVLKGRQQGCSTYVQSRYFNKTNTTFGKKAYILTHEREATANIFDITKRYYDNLPEGLQPETKTSNAKKLEFKQLQSEYAVGTAKNKGTGRSQTIHLFHGSEVAYWPNASAHEAGIINAVPNAPGTEIILESTAQGIGNYFHNQWENAVRGANEYCAIFIPWFWQTEYRSTIAHYQNSTQSDFILNDEEDELFYLHKNQGMTREALCWRRLKLAGTSGDEHQKLIKFKSEYPNYANEAFQNPVANTFIPARFVATARKNKVDSDNNLIIGVDPAVGDTDRTAIIRRRGRLAYGLDTVLNHNTMEIAGKVSRIIRDENPVKVYVDCIGIGKGVVDRLNDMGYHNVHGINVARTANDRDRFGNLRAELWSEMKDWLMGEMPVQIPDSNELEADLCSLGYKHKSGDRLFIESKDELRKRGLPSCDTADALMLTFAAGQYAGDNAIVVNTMPLEHQGMWT